MVNQVRSKDDITLGSPCGVLAQNIWDPLEYVGYIGYDDCVWQATKKKPLLVEYPTRAPQDVLSETHHLKHEQRLDFLSIHDLPIT